MSERHFISGINLLGPSIEIDISLIEGYIDHVLIVPSSSQGLKWRFPSFRNNEIVENTILLWLEAYCTKKPLPSLPFNWNGISSFTQRVLSFLEKIPNGSVFSYGEVAQQIENPKAYRAVGNACGKNPFPFFIPCHRVIAAHNKLGGFSCDIEIKKRLLLFEGYL